MNRDEWRRLFIRRRELTGETFNDGTIDAWQTAFPTLGHDTGIEALNGAARLRDRVNVHTFTEALPRPQPAAYPDPSDDESDWEPITASEIIHQLLNEGIEAGRAERLARAQHGDPSAFARLMWWRNDAQGHYPGCRCKRCQGIPT